jgi:capsular polysaccharide transport system permease protein
MLQYSNENAGDVRGNFVERIRRINLLFIFVVVVPTVLSIIYFGLIASDVYVSDSYFVVKSEKKEPNVGISAIFSSHSGAGGGTEVFAVEEYMNSRDALADLNKNGIVTRAYTRDNIDVFSRFGGAVNGEGSEDLYRYYKKRVAASFDNSKSVTNLRVRAYTPEDAYRINMQLLALGENLVNRLNERSRTDLVRYAENEVNEAKERAARSAIALSEYRNRRGIVDPEKQAEVQVQLISKLQDEMIATQTQLDELIRFAPENPQVPVYRQRIASIQRQIQQESGKVAGGQRSLAGTAPGYERVFLENEFAAKQLTGALAALQDAKNEARRQQIYVERIVQPSRPDKAVEPKRLKGIASTLLLGLLFYGIARLLFAGIKEHQP